MASEELSYVDIMVGHDEPDVAWCNGTLVLEMRKKFGDDNLNDSDGNPILVGQVYMLTRGRVDLYIIEEEPK